MIITATKDFSKVTFTWNEDLTECSHVAIGVSDEDFNALINANAHEGSDAEGWDITIK